MGSRAKAVISSKSESSRAEEEKQEASDRSGETATREGSPFRATRMEGALLGKEAVSLYTGLEKRRLFTQTISVSSEGFFSLKKYTVSPAAAASHTACSSP